jgi:hypothetical protein
MDATQWPAEGTVSEFEIWWMDERPQIRLIPTDARYRREDFAEWILAENTGAGAEFRRRHAR